MIFVIGSVIFLIIIFRSGDFIETWDIVKLFGALIIGILILILTLPSLKSIITRDYDIVSGKCTIDISPSSRRSESTFNMIDTGEQFYFDRLPPLDAYGKAVPYYCEVTVTKDHKYEIDYKIYDLNTKELID